MQMDEKTKQLLKQEELKQKHLDDYRKFRIAINAIAKDPNGEIVLRHIAKISGFFKSSIVLKGGGGVMNGVDTEGMLVNEGRRALYLDLRRPMSDEVRRLIEGKGQGEEND
jgi:cobalamin biosynthesis protein CbiD